MISRRRLLAAGLVFPLKSLARICGAITPRQTEGPFYSPGTPLRTSLLEGGEKTRFVLAGSVLSADCKPMANALVDLWHCDEEGVYDTHGFRYRGHQFTDGEGRYRFETIVPALYPGRTRHFHLKVQPRGGRLLTTQVYWPNEPANRRDAIYRRELEMRLGEGEGRFDFVVA